VSWHHRIPEGISSFEKTDEGFQASLSLPADEDGFFGRECPACQQPFKVLVDQWEALPDEAIITCPYCGKQPEDVNDFMTGDQSARVEAALNALVEQYTHQLFSETLDKAFRSK
jgi:endogenous inhibitor of DNA gyrase (YacG/DUF329 family)